MVILSKGEVCRLSSAKACVSMKIQYITAALNVNKGGNQKHACVRAVMHVRHKARERGLH